MGTGRRRKVTRLYFLTCCKAVGSGDGLTDAEPAWLRVGWGGRGARWAPLLPSSSPRHAEQLRRGCALPCQCVLGESLIHGSLT